MGYNSPAEQKNAPNPAREVPRRHLEQKKVSFPARKKIPLAYRAEKHPNSCAEGATEAFGAEKGIIFCAEWDTTRLPGKKMLPILRGRCYGGIWSRKRHHFLRRMGYQPPAGQEKEANPARKVCRECTAGAPRRLQAEIKRIFSNSCGNVPELA